MKQTFVIGDIHGADKALAQALERAPIQKGDTLIFVGDYVDGWSENVEVVNRLMDLQKDHFCIFLRGNHDQWLQDWLYHRFADDTWLAHGGQITMENYEALDDDTREKHHRFLKSLHWYYIDMNERLFVHAGFTSKKGPEEENDKRVLFMDRTLWQKAYASKDRSPGSFFYPKKQELFREIYLGHTPTINNGTDLPIIANNVINIDTGAAFTGRVTVMNVDTKAYWQSDIVQDLYPEELGRNKS